MTHRIDNFCAGPCTLPLPVLERAQAELLNYKDSGMSIMEISHRSKLFEPIHYNALQLAREVIGAPNEFATLFMTGGASQQFAITAMNLLTADNCAGFVNSGIWAQKAFQECQRIGQAIEVWSGKPSEYKTLPTEQDFQLAKNTRYLHITSNETIDGIQFHTFPKADTPLVIDASSDFYARSIPWEQCDIVYGGAQKNLAPAGLTIVFVRRTILQDHPHLPKYFNYKTHADTDSLYNTPPTWQIYLLSLTLEWIKNQGGLPHFNELAKQRSSLLYDAIDSSDFYHNTIAPEYRSYMNVVFRTPSEELDTLFWQTAEKTGLSGLKGHRLVGGIRASLYNALSVQSVEHLLEFMQQFEQQYG